MSVVLGTITVALYSAYLLTSYIWISKFDPDVGLTFKTLGLPKRKTIEFESPTGPSTRVRYDSKNNSIACAIVYTYMNATDSADRSPRNIRNLIVNNANHQLVSEAEFSLNGFEGYEVICSIKNTNKLMRTRSVFVNNLLFQFTAVSNTDPAGLAHADKFFSSIAIDPAYIFTD